MPGSPILCIVKAQNAKTINEIALRGESYGQLQALLDDDYGNSSITYLLIVPIAVHCYHGAYRRRGLSV